MESDMVVHTFNRSSQEERQADLSVFGDNLVYEVSSWTRLLHTDTLPKEPRWGEGVEKALQLEAVPTK